QTPAAVAMALASFCRKPQPRPDTPRRETRPAAASEPTLVQDDTPMPGPLRSERTPKLAPATARGRRCQLWRALAPQGGWYWRLVLHEGRLRRGRRARFAPWRVGPWLWLATERREGHRDRGRRLE